MFDCEPAKTTKMRYISPQCQYYVIRKKRLCRMTVKPGKNYCGEHEPQPKTDEGQDDTRIPCPNDPKHTCYVSKLEKHLSICNARQQQQPCYIVHNVNAPAATDDRPRLPLAELPLRRILQVIDKVNMLYDTHLKDKIATLPEYPIHSAVAQEFSEAGRTESSLRHLRQASALLHVVEGEQLVQNNTAYVELGAGKGHLSYYAWHAWCRRSDSRVLLVDRASLRHKRDNKLRDNTRPTTATTADNAHATTPTTGKNAHATTPTTADNAHATTLTTGNNAHATTPTTADNSHATTPTTANNAHATTLNQVDDDVTSTGKVTLNVRNVRGTTPDGSNNVVPNNVDTNHIIYLENGVNTKTDNVSHEHNDIDTKNEPTDINLNPNDTVNRLNGPKTNDDLSENSIKKVPMPELSDSQQSDIDAKANNEMNKVYEEMNGDACDSNVQRIRADLAHLVLGRVPAVQACGGVVGIAKHLCGVATDLALRCITSADVRAKTRGVVLATCCHHRCARAAYPAADALQNLGIDADDFNTLLGVVSWATCGDGRSRDRRNRDSSASDLNIGSNAVDNPERTKESDNPTETVELGTKNLGLSQQERETVGRRAKALLDWGRVLYLRGRGFDARLVHYVPTSVSLENMCIVATK